jgi:hypothetical protein
VRGNLSITASKFDISRPNLSQHVSSKPCSAATPELINSRIQGTPEKEYSEFS